jgi:hypothetical protein
MLRPIIYTFTYPGALTGDQDPYFTVPMDVQLVHVSAQCITQDATIFLEDDGTAITDSKLRGPGDRLHLHGRIAVSQSVCQRSVSEKWKQGDNYVG